MRRTAAELASTEFERYADDVAEAKARRRKHTLPLPVFFLVQLVLLALTCWYFGVFERETGAPAELLSRPDSLFSSMVKDTGNATELRARAKAAAGTKQV